jgi:hypothetical protein
MAMKKLFSSPDTRSPFEAKETRLFKQNSVEETISGLKMFKITAENCTSNDLMSVSSPSDKPHNHQREKRSVWPPENYRRDPEEDYFRLTCLAIKMNLFDACPQGYFNLATDILYVKCKAK